MSELEVRILTLEPMRVASVYAFGQNPEIAAWEKLMAWVKSRGMDEQLAEHRIFGFNNPNPSPGSPNYGYELWISVGDEVEPEGEVRILGFEGGMYAVTRCEVGEDPQTLIPETWKRLVEWLVDSKYKHASHQWLEEFVGANVSLDDLVLDLHAPIAE